MRGLVEYGPGVRARAPVKSVGRVQGRARLRGGKRGERRRERGRSEV